MALRKPRAPLAPAAATRRTADRRSRPSSTSRPRLGARSRASLRPRRRARAHARDGRAARGAARPRERSRHAVRRPARDDRADRALTIADASDAPLWFIGDLHGDLLALEAALALIDARVRRARTSTPARSCFLGDLFDDGGYGLESAAARVRADARALRSRVRRRRQSRRGARLQRRALHRDRVARRTSPTS